MYKWKDQDNLFVSKGEGGEDKYPCNEISRLTVWILAAIVSDGLAFLDAAIGVTLTEADIAFIITVNFGVHTIAHALFVFKIASAYVVGAIVTLASKIVVPAIVVRVAGTVPASQITQTDIIFALFVIVADLVLAISVKYVVVGIK